MRKPKILKKGDKVAIVSLSSGILGEAFCAHQVELGKKRLLELGLEPVFMTHTLKGGEYVHEHPESRAQDLKDAYMDDSIKAIICAIGGDDTFRITPYLFEDNEFINKVQSHPKIFIGFSDSTNNHFMFQKLGVVSYYGINFLNDLAELAVEMLPYTKQSYELLFNSQSNIAIESSPVWYEERTNHSNDAIGTNRIKHQETKGYEVLNSHGKVSGKLLGGCLESIFDMITGNRYPEQKVIYEKYKILPTLETWKDKILFIETSEETPSPEEFETMIALLIDERILTNVKALVVGKPQNGIHYEAYKQILMNAGRHINVPILYNVNFGHAYPHALLPYGIEVEIDFDSKKFTIIESMYQSDTV